jgi:hypothetical protein
MAGGLANLYIPYLNMPSHLLWFGQLLIYNPSFPLLHPQQYMAMLMISVPPVLPVNYPRISKWLVLCDNHPQHSREDFTSLVSKFDKEGF